MSADELALLAARESAAAAQIAAQLADTLSRAAAATAEQANLALAAAQAAAMKANADASAATAQATTASQRAAQLAAAVDALAAKVAAENTVTVPTTADSFVSAASPTVNYGTNGSLLSRGSTAATSYLGFAIPAAPLGKHLVAATLRFRTTTDPAAGSASSHAVHLASGSWTETAITWANRPVPAAGALGALASGSVANTSYDVPLDVAALAGQVGHQATLAVDSTGTDALYLFSRSATTAGNRPVLLLTWSF